MGFFDKFRFQHSQTTPTKPNVPRFAPGWLAENQRTAIRTLAAFLAVSVGGNIYQMKLRESVATAPPEVFTAIMDADFSTAKVVNMRNLKVDEVEAMAAAEVRRFVYRLRRVDNPEQVQDNINMLYCSVTGAAAVKANRSFERGKTPDLLKIGKKRILLEKGVRAGLRPGERAKEDGMWISATWNEEVDEGVRRITVQRSAEFLVKRFKDISPQIRACNPMGTLIADYELFDAD